VNILFLHKLCLIFMALLNKDISEVKLSLGFIKNHAMKS
jgi:hypothetical protein